jgi:hypothetical protein
MRLITTRSEAKEVSRRKIRKKILTALEYGTFLREPRLMLLCNTELEKDLRQSMVENYVDICEELDCIPFSMTWNLEILLDKKGKPEEILLIKEEENE